MRVAANGIYDINTRWANVFWIRNAAQTQPGSAAMEQLAKLVYDAYAAQFLPLLEQSVVLEGTQLIYYGEGGSQLGSQWVQNTNGTVTDIGSAANVACCISWLVPERYRGGHPRTYLPGIPTTALLGRNTFTDTFRTAVRLAADQFHATVNAFAGAALSPVHLGTVSFVHDAKWRTPPVFRDYTPGAAEVDVRVDTQRRRLGPDR